MLKKISFLCFLVVFLLCFFAHLRPLSAALILSDIQLNTPGMAEGSAHVRFYSHKEKTFAIWQGVIGSERALLFQRSDTNGKTWLNEERIVVRIPLSYQFEKLEISSDDSRLYLSWLQNYSSSSGSQSIYIAVSADEGETWQIQQVASVASSDFAGMDTAHNKNGGICVVWASDQIYSRCSSDAGQSWSAATVVNTTTPPIHSRDVQREPAVAAGEDGKFYVVWTDNRGATGVERFVYVTRSLDGGLTWETDRMVVNFPSNGPLCIEPDIIADQNDRVLVSWINKIWWGQGETYRYSISTAYSLNAGSTWNAGATMNSYGISPQLLVDELTNKFFIFWLNDNNHTYRKLQMCSSDDGGASWTPSIVVGPHHDVQETNYHAAVSRNVITAVWDNREPWPGIYLNYSFDGGLTWLDEELRADHPPTDETPITRPDVTVTPNESILLGWQDERNGLSDIFFNYWTPDVSGGTSVYQNFEPANGSDEYGWGFNGAAVEVSSEEAHSGEQSWKVISVDRFGGTGIQSQTQRWDMNCDTQKHDRLVFWIYAIPDEGNDNNVSVKFFDTGAYSDSGFEVWSTQEAQFREWTRIEILFSQLPQDFDLGHINKLEFVNYWPGTYYIDDIFLAVDDRVYQSFERCSSVDDCGWSWGGEVALDTEIVYEGKQSFRLQAHEYWAGTGIKSQEKKYNPSEGQTFWHVNLDPARNDRLVFWVYSLAENRLDNNVAVQFFDHGDYFNEPAVIWTNKRAVYGEWTRLSVRFSELPDNLDLRDINKIQIQVYYPGTYYFDDLRATARYPLIDKSGLSSGLLHWDEIPGADQYEVQESSSGPQGPWQTLYEGSDTDYLSSRLAESWLRVRWKEFPSETYPLPYRSQWSDIAHYQPRAVLIHKASLEQGDVEWNSIPQTETYQVVAAPSASGPWTQIYEGPLTVLEKEAEIGNWYRVRAVKEEVGAIADAGAWSPALIYYPYGYLRAVGTILKDQNGEGRKISLKGVNLGNLLLIEPEFTGIGGDFTPENKFDDDDYNIRSELVARFGVMTANELLKTYQDAYIQESDFDNLLRMGVNFVRLPFYYQALQDEEGNFTNFEKIDEIVNFCADRGIYLLLDLHGAPGAQSAETHSGRAGYNRLFEDSSEGEMYREQTVKLWQAVAAHYKDNTTVMGYDLLNEPFGALEYDPSFTSANGLWTLYDYLYQAIREIDPQHIVVMESIPSEFDWDTLPDPLQFGWQNVVYQNHYYGFVFDDDGNISGTMSPEEHVTYIDDKIANSRQEEYQVPVLIGEFNGFNNRSNWEYYLNTFYQQDWGWALWNYKAQKDYYDWGLYVHNEYYDDFPDVSHDSLEILSEKFAKYDTVSHHSPNASLIDIVKGKMMPLWVAAHTPNAVKARWFSVDFSEAFGSVPVLIVGMETFKGGNTASLRIQNCSEDGFDVKVEEETSKDRETNHKAETVGYFALNAGMIRDSSGTQVGESGFVSMDQTRGNIWQTLNLTRSYHNPVVFMQIVSFADGDPAHIRIRNVHTDSFQYQIEEWDYQDQIHGVETIAYVVLEQGLHELKDGTKIEVGLTKANDKWKNVAFQQAFYYVPVTISQSQTRNGAQAIISRQKTGRETGFKVKVQEEEGRDKKHAKEIVGYLAVSTDR